MPTPPAGFSISIPTGPPPDYTKMIENDPWYKQALEWNAAAAAKAEEQIRKDMARENEAYLMNVAQANASASGGGDHGLAAAQAQAALQKETAAHENKNQLEYLRELLASRGMADSGQKEWESKEQEFQYGQMLKGIEADLQARASAASAARSQAQAGLSLQLQEMKTRHGWAQEDYQSALGDLPGEVARGRGQAAFDAYQRLLASGGLEAPAISAIWDETSGLYKTSDGRFFDQHGNPASYSPPSATAPAPPAAPPAYYEPPPSTSPYGPPLPQLPKPGGPYIAV